MPATAGKQRNTQGMHTQGMRTRRLYVLSDVKRITNQLASFPRYDAIIVRLQLKCEIHKGNKSVKEWGMTCESCACKRMQQKERNGLC